MKFALALISLIAVAQAKTLWHQLDAYTFDMYEAEYHKVYSIEERLVRATIFEERLAVVKMHNSEPAHTWKRGVNHLTDRTKTELATLHGLNKPQLFAEKQARAAKEQAPHTVTIDTSKLPPARDWRDEGVVTPVKNQGVCGSCWTFASTEALESQWAIYHGKQWLQELSEQFILDCTPNPLQCGGTGGCMGGTGEMAYTSVKTHGGIPSEYTYPYLSILGNASTCHGLDANGKLPPAEAHHGEPSAAANVTGMENVASNSYAAVMDASANRGPMAISVDAGDWHDYETGIFSGGNKTNPELDHLVSLIGYGSEQDGKRKKDQSDYWIVRNSWTPLWGEAGYIRLARYGESDAGEPCGVDVNPSDGNGCKGGPSTVKVCGQNGMLFDVLRPIVGGGK